MVPLSRLPVSLERNPFTCCKCTFPCGNKNVKLLQNKLKSYVARFTTTFKHVLQQIRWSGCCSLRKYCLTEKNNTRLSHHTRELRHLLWNKFALDSAGKTRSMCRFCCKKDNVSQPATTVRGTQRKFSKNICSEDDLRSRIFGTFVVKFLAYLPLLGFSNI